MPVSILRLAPRFPVAESLIGPWDGLLKVLRETAKDDRQVALLVRPVEIAKQQAIMLNSTIDSIVASLQELTLSAQSEEDAPVVVSNVPTFHDNEVVVPDGVSSSVTLAVAPNPPQSLQLSFNGQVLYTGSRIVSVSGNVVALTFVPAVGALMRAWYRS